MDCGASDSFAVGDVPSFDGGASVADVLSFAFISSIYRPTVSGSEWSMVGEMITFYPRKEWILAVLETTLSASVMDTRSNLAKIMHMTLDVWVPGICASQNGDGRRLRAINTGKSCSLVQKFHVKSLHRILKYAMPMIMIIPREIK